VACWRLVSLSRVTGQRYEARAFGDELARINFLPEKCRKQAVAEMIDCARSKGVDLSRPALGVTP